MLTRHDERGEPREPRESMSLPGFVGCCPLPLIVAPAIMGVLLFIRILCSFALFPCLLTLP